MSKSNSVWIDVCQGRDGLLLREYQFPYHDLTGLKEPEMIMFIGGKGKTTAMKKWGLLPAETYEHGKIHLRSVTRYTSNSSPLLIADCELQNIPCLPEAPEGPIPPYLKQRPLLWSKFSGTEPYAVSNLVYSKLLYHFSTTICLFANDLGGTLKTAKILASWLQGQNNRLFDTPHPQIVILKEPDDLNLSQRGSNISFMGELSQAVRLLNMSCGPMTRAQLEVQLTQRFGDVKVLALPSHSRSSAWTPLRSNIISSSKAHQRRRRENHMTFSADHLRAFLHLACDHFARDIVSPFSFIKASRGPNPIPSTLSTNLTYFMKKVKASEVIEFAVPLIASALTLDSYPPGMHYFRPGQVFRELYGRVFRDLHMNIYGDNKVSFAEFEAAVESRFCEQVTQNLRDGNESAATHKAVLCQFRPFWSNLYSHTRCFSCLARKCENTLECRHSFCDTCTIIHGLAEPNDPWKFKIPACPLCNVPNLIEFKLKPYTAGVRCLSLDGGGSRGIIACCFLWHLHRILALPVPIQDHFDIAVGTSSGGLIVLGLYCNGWSIDECINQFHKLSRTAFRPRSFTSCLPLQGFLFSLLADSRYPSSGINAAVKEAFGQKLLFDCSANGTKIAVTATRTKDSLTHLLANYNGCEERSGGCDYKLVRPESISEDPPVWHAARATSAAPLYFRSFHGYHDGALGGHNNPIMLAVWEQDLIWSRGKKEPDLVVSLGTGFKASDQQEIESPGIKDRILSMLQGTSIPRLTRSYMLLLEAEKRNREYQNSLKPAAQSRYHRMTIEFHETEPSLDDIRAIPNMVAHVESFVDANEKLLRQCADNVIASLFYITITGLPLITETGVIFELNIRCRWAPSPALLALLQQLQETRAYFYYDNQKSIPCVDAQLYEGVKGGAAFLRCINLVVSSFADTIDVKLHDMFQRGPRSISNCPYEVSALIQDQGLLCMFGHKDHKRRFQGAAEQMAKRQHV